MLVVLWFKSSLPVREVTSFSGPGSSRIAAFKSSLPVREMTVHIVTSLYISNV